MAAPTAHIILEGWRDSRGRFAAQSEALVKRQQQVARDVLTTMVQRAQDLSPRQDETLHTKREPGQPPFAEQWTKSVRTTKEGAEGEVTNTSEYANLVLFPTRAHPIEKGPPGALAFEVDGEQVVTHHVQHPGTRGHPEIAQQLDDEFSRTAQSQLQRVALAAAVGIEGVFSRFAGRL